MKLVSFGGAAMKIASTFMFLVFMNLTKFEPISVALNPLLRM